MAKETRLIENPQSTSDEVSVSKRGNLVKKLFSHTNIIIEIAHPIILGLARNYRLLYPVAALLGGIKAGMREANKEIKEREKEQKEKKDDQSEG